MRFVIIGSARTGSSHLVNMLGAHPQILCNGNIFHPKQVFVFWPEGHPGQPSRAELRDLRNNDPDAFLELVYRANFDKEHVGFKIFEWQQDEILAKLIGESSVKKVILYRKNVLAAFSSKLAAGKTGKFGAKEGESVGEIPKVRFVPRQFVEFHERFNAFYRNVIDRLNKEHQPFHLIDYDEINDPYLFSALVNFIGADAALEAPRSEQRKKQVKQNSSDICSRFSNPESVIEFLRENGLLHWAQEGETCLRSASLGQADADDDEPLVEEPDLEAAADHAGSAA